MLSVLLQGVLMILMVKTIFLTVTAVTSVLLLPCLLMYGTNIILPNCQNVVTQNLYPARGCLDDFNCSFPCYHREHKAALPTFCDNLASCVKAAAENCIEAKSPGSKNLIGHLSCLTLKGYLLIAIWEAKRRPKSGFINNNWLICKYRCKRAIRVARNNFQRNFRNKSADKLLNDDSRSFWPIWNAEFFNSKFLHTGIGGIYNASKVAQSFADSFSNNFYDQLLTIS